jgi:hypothetical protein
MTGKQATFAIDGAQNEDVAKPLIGRLSAPVQVGGGPRDFGADFFCQLYLDGGHVPSRSVDAIFALQVKGLTAPLTFGGLDKHGNWRSYELEWLRTLAVPFFLGRVDAADARLDLYSLGTAWRLFWEHGQPFEIDFVTEAFSDATYHRQEPTSATTNQTFGDSKTWTVPLGPPFLSLRHGELQRGLSTENALALLRRHVEMEHANLIRFQLGVAIHSCVAAWSSNEFAPQFVVHKAMYWNAGPGTNIAKLIETLAPVVVNLGVNLQWQHDPDSDRLIDVLDWLESRGALDEMGVGLLSGLRADRARRQPSG